MTKNEETILNNLVKTLQDHENECYRQQAYNRSWLEVASAIDKIKKLEE